MAMNVVRSSESVEHLRLVCYRWPRDIAWPKRVGLALTMAVLTGLAAQVRIPLADTPVPVTGQVFMVLLSGVLLGGPWGGLSQALYVGLGAAGVPWFTGWAAGVPAGPTAGYLMGFIVAASWIGWVTDRFTWARFFVPQLALMMVGVAVILTLGAVGFHLTTGLGLVATLKAAFVPFVFVDLFKAIAAAGISSTLLPKRSGDTGMCNGR